VAVLSRQTKYYLEDGSAATLNILLAAHAHGLGACWVAGDKKPYAARVVQMVGAPEDYRLISLVSIGYPAEKPETGKRALREMLHWERF
jgi:nitroreductase